MDRPRDEFRPGDLVEYRCLGRKTWVPCKIEKVRPEGVFLSGRRTILEHSAVPERVRFPPGVGDKASQSAHGSGVVDKARCRQTHDPGWDKYVTNWVEKMGSVRAIFGKFMETYMVAEELARLKDQIVEAFPSPKHVRRLSTSFLANPGGTDKIEGYIYPSRWETLAQRPPTILQRICLETLLLP